MRAEAPTRHRAFLASTWADARIRGVAAELYERRLRTHNQKITVAASAMAERKTVGDLS